MAFNIHTNTASLKIMRNLNINKARSDLSMERIGSGKRINSAKDDAAGLAIATRFTTQIKGLAQALKNANDGISLAQTSEGALNQITKSLQRIRELALQSSNSSNSVDDRKALDKEVAVQLAEITRIAAQTNFNGVKVLDGSRGSISFQVGANVGEVVNMVIGGGVRADQVGQLAKGGVDLTSAFVKAPYAYSQQPATDWSATNGKTLGKQAYDGTDVDWSAYKGASVNDAKGFLGAALGTDFEVTVNGDNLDVARVGGDRLVLGKGELTFQLGNGERVDIVGSFRNTQAVADAINAQSRSGISAFVGGDGALRFASASAIGVEGSRASALGFDASYAIDNSGTLADGSVKTRDAAYELIARVDASLSAISETRSGLGAVQSRLEAAVRNVETMSENLTTSRSAIQDTDMAQEMAEKVVASILQQAGVSILAQANSSHQLVLKLLE